MNFIILFLKAIQVELINFLCRNALLQIFLTRLMQNKIIDRFNNDLLKGCILIC